MLTLLLAFVLQTAAPQQAAPTTPAPDTPEPPRVVTPIRDNPARVGVRIVGEVAKPGTYYLNGPTIPELIAAAGGFTEKANRDAITWRHKTGEARARPFSYDYTGKGLNIWSKTVIVWPGDVIEVPAVDPPVAKR